MRKGDSVIINHPDSNSKEFVRSYGIVHEITKVGAVIIGMADGSLNKHEYNSIAVYVHPPSNWDELFQHQSIVFSQPKRQMMTRIPSKTPAPT